MVIPEKDKFIEKSRDSLSEMYDSITALPNIELSSLDPQNTALIVIDMINGFVKSGALYSDRVGGLEKGIAALAKRCGERGIQLVALCDCHTQASPELSSFPPHCMADTVEAELIDSLKPFGFKIINKNSAGALSVPEFEQWLRDNEHIQNYIVVGDCTDICIYQNAVGIKARCNHMDKSCRVILPIDYIDTYDLPGHDADLINIAHVYSMMGNGVEAVKDIL